MQRINSYLMHRMTVCCLAAAVALLGTACGPRLKIVTDPPGSRVIVRNPAGSAVRSGPAPLVASVAFGGGDDRYVVEVEPTSTMAERYLPTSKEIGRSDYEALPADRDSGICRLEVKLDEKEFVTVTYLEVVLDAQRRWRGVVTRSRAYRDVGETGGAVPTRIVEFGDNMGIQAMALSPDGNRTVYSVATYSKSVEELKKIFAASEPRHLDIAGANLHAVSFDGGGIEHITSENFRDMFPSSTPDGYGLLFSSNRRRPHSEDLLLISAYERSGISNVYVDNRSARILRPTQASNGTIAFAIEEPSPIDAKNRFTIWTLGGPKKFPTQIQTGNQPAISPDGDRITYIGPDGNLWVVNTNGSHATQLTSGAGSIMQRYKESLSPAELRRYEWSVKELGVPEKMPYSYPSWSSDGQSILCTSMEGSDPTGRPNEDIWIMRFDGSGKHQLTTNGSIDRFPLMSPDLKWIYFMSNRGGRWAIWRIEATQLESR